MEDSKLSICFYCGDVMQTPTKEQMKIFGKPTCCEREMLVIDSSNLHMIVKSIDTLKANLEKEILKDVM